MRFELALVRCPDHWVDLFALVQTATLVVTRVAFFRKDQSCRVSSVEGLEHGHGIIACRQDRTLLRPLGGQVAQVFQTLVVGGETARPQHAEQRQCRQRAHVKRPLAPMDATAFALVQTGQIGLGENHPTEQVVNEARTATAQGRQHARVHAQIGTDAGGGLVHFLGQVRRAGQVETAQLADTLVAVAGERHVDKQAQALADLSQLMREVEDAATALGVAFLVHVHDHLAVETTQQRFKLGAQYGHVGATLLFAEAGAEHLIAFFAGQLIEEFVETEQFVGLAQHQINRHVDVEFLMHVLQARTYLAGQGVEVLLAATQQGFHWNGHQHAVQWAVAATLAQQVEQSAPGTAIDFGIRLGQVTPGSVDQYTVVGEVPVAMTGAEGIAGQFAVDLVDRKFEAREVQQAGLATALRADQQVPWQIAAPAFAATTIQAGGLEGFQGVFETHPQLSLLLVDQLFAADTVLAVFGVFDGFFTHTGAPADEDHGQAPNQKQHADGQQARGRAFPELVVIHRQQRPDEPHQKRDKQHHQQGPDPGLAQKCAEFLKKLFHHTSLFTAATAAGPRPNQAADKVAERCRAARPIPRRNRNTSPPGRRR